MSPIWATARGGVRCMLSGDQLGDSPVHRSVAARGGAKRPPVREVWLHRRAGRDLLCLYQPLIPIYGYPAADTVYHVDSRSIQEAVMVTTRILLLVANAGSPSTPHLLEDALLALMNTYDWDAVQRLTNRWRFYFPFGWTTRDGQDPMRRGRACSVTRRHPARASRCDPSPG